MRRWMAAFLFAAAAALALTGDHSTAVAQQAPEEESFNTADGVRLKGLFHKSPKGGQGDPVVILMYAPGADRTMLKPGDWGGLAKELNDKGFHVFRFDWRGHGKSTDIVDTDAFWKTGFTAAYNNRYIKGSRSKPVKSTLNVKTDINPSYFPVFVNDLAAVRMHIDQKNDQGNLNSSSIYLIGSEDAATLGMLWMTSEWFRPAVHPMLFAGQQYKATPTPGIVVDPPAGADIAGAVWLSAAKPSQINSRIVEGWPKLNLKMRDNNPMLFLYGTKDPTSARHSKFFYDEMLVAKGNERLGVKSLDQTFLTGVDTKLGGVNLLGKNSQIGVEDTIMKYLEARQKDRVSLTRKERKYVGPYYIDLRYFGF